MINTIILKMSSIISTIGNGKKLLVNRAKSKIISSASKCSIEGINKRNLNRYDSGKVSNQKYDTSAKHKVKEIRI